MSPRLLARLALLAAAPLPLAAPAADIVISPPAAGGVAITNATGNATRLRVADDGTVTLPGLTALPVAGTGLCIDLATGRVGSCAAGGSGTVTSLVAGTGLTGGTITTSGTIAADTTYLQRRVSGTCAAGSSIRSIAADGTVTCQADTAGAANAFVQGGNAFGASANLGTTDNQPVQILANGLASLRLLPNATSPNLVAGHPGNAVTAGVAAATVAGGGSTFSSFPLPSDAGTGIICLRDCKNTVTDHGGTIGGGVDNQAGNGTGTLTDAPYATIAGGMRNLSTAQGSFVGGGIGNTASGLYALVTGGADNIASGTNSVVVGGQFNQANAQDSIAAGYGARANHVGSFVWSGLSPSSPIGSGLSSIAENEFAVHAEGGVRIVTKLVSVTGAPFNEAGTFRMLPDGRLELPSFTGALYRGSSLFLHATGAGNSFVGVAAGTETTSGAGNNTGAGSGALGAISTGFENAAVGRQALGANDTGAGNTAVGYRALATNTGSFNGTAVGAQALANATGAGNVAVGAFSGYDVTTGQSNILIGNVGAAAESNTIRLGDANQNRAFISGIRGVTTGLANAIAVFVDSNGQLGTASSSRRVKDDIADLGETSEVLMSLRPVSFRYKSHVADGVDEPQVGFVAEEVAEVAPFLAARAADGRIETVKYHFLAPLLVNEVQKQQRTIDAQRAELEALRADVAAMKRALGLDR